MAKKDKKEPTINEEKIAKDSLVEGQELPKEEAPIAEVISEEKQPKELSNVSVEDAKKKVGDIEVFGEDVFALEGMQQARHSPGFSGGIFSPVMDVPSHHFHQWVAQRYKQSTG